MERRTDSFYVRPGGLDGIRVLPVLPDMRYRGFENATFVEWLEHVVLIVPGRMAGHALPGVPAIAYGLNGYRATAC